MNLDSIVFDLSVIIVGAAVLGTLFLSAKQPIVVAYIALGVLIGPNGFGVIRGTDHIQQISHLGVILLLFLIGLNLQPVKLLKLFKRTSILTFSTSIVFCFVSFLCALLLRFDIRSALIIGAAMMFSSTIIGLKLIPTTALHHKRTGELMTSVLLLQDMLAVLVILFIAGERSDYLFLSFLLLLGKFIVISLLSFAGVRFVVIPLLTRFDVVQEYSFVATLAWCLFWAQVAHMFGLSYEMGAFLAGLSIASSRIALVIAEHLKPLREFFLILFFFAVGAKLNLRLDPVTLLSAIIFGTILVPLKSFVFRFAFRRSGESPEMSSELAARLAQASEFSLLVALTAVSVGALSNQVAMFIRIVTIVTFIVSTYWVVLKHPTPISGSSQLRRD